MPDFLRRGPLRTRGVRAIHRTSEGLLRGRALVVVAGLPLGQGDPGANPTALPGEGPPDPSDLPSEWSGRRVIVAEDDVLYTASEADTPYCLPVLTKWRDGKPEIIARATYRPAEGSEIAKGVAYSHSFSSEDLIWTPDGNIWAADERLQRLDHGSWHQYPLSDRGAVREHHFRDGLNTINRKGPRWILRPESGLEGLWRLDHSPGFEQATLEPIHPDDEVRDAIALDENRIAAVAKEGKLVLFDVRRSQFLPWPGPTPSGKIAHITRDGVRRPWLASDSLSLLDPVHRKLRALADYGIVSTPVTAIAPDPEHVDGVVLATSGNEVAFVRAIRR